MTDQQQPQALSLADWLDAVGNGSISTTAAAAELRRLHAENEALRRDAERYRHLRDGVIVGGEINECLYVHIDHPSHPNRWALAGPELDAAIDAALQHKEDAP